MKRRAVVGAVRNIGSPTLIQNKSRCSADTNFAICARCHTAVIEVFL